MDPGTAAFILIIIAMIMVTAIITTWMQTRAPAKSAGAPAPERDPEALSRENAELRGQVRHLESRIAVLERIATDPAERTAREIENLR